MASQGEHIKNNNSASSLHRQAIKSMKYYFIKLDLKRGTSEGKFRGRMVHIARTSLSNTYFLFTKDRVLNSSNKQCFTAGWPQLVLCGSCDDTNPSFMGDELTCKQPSCQTQAGLVDQGSHWQRYFLLQRLLGCGPVGFWRSAEWCPSSRDKENDHKVILCFNFFVTVQAVSGRFFSLRMLCYKNANMLMFAKICFWFSM